MERFLATLAKIGRAVQEGRRRRRRGCRRRALGCLGFVALLVALLAALLFALFGRVGAQAAPSGEELVVELVIDNSNSMFDKGGVGSDPELLRLAAARLFIESLGVDDSRLRPSCGLIFFGSQARQVAAPVRLSDAGARAALLERLSDPARLGWTDQLGALQLARRALAPEAGRKVIVILTDGKPEWSDQPTAAERDDYRAQMARLGRQLAAEDTALFILLLAGPQTDADEEIATVWQPMWQAMAAATPDGRFLVVRDAAELPATYHDIVVALTSRQSHGAVVDGHVTPQGLRETVSVEPGLARLILVVRKSHADTTVAIQMPGGVALRPRADGSVSRTGGALEEVWTITAPPAGDWLVTANGQGRLTIWKDFELAPTATPTVAPSPTPLPSATATPQPTATATPLPPTPTAAVIPPGPVDATPPAEGGQGWLPGALLALTVPLAGGGYWLLRRRSRLPVVAGTLHVLAEGEARSRTAFDLYALGKPAVTIGDGAADVRLVGLPVALTLRARPQPTGEPEIVAAANADVLYNGRRLLTEQPLYDGDVLTIGQTRLRYENLQRRRPRRRAAGSRPPGGAALYDSTRTR